MCPAQHGTGRNGTPKTLMDPQESHRPDPDDLLRQIQEQEKHDERGRLKIFLGFAPRVGKSVRMFDEGLRRLKRGQDVIVGAIQRQGAEHLECYLRQMEIIPAHGVCGHDLAHSEVIDVEAILARHPQVCLIDELARENPPGSRNQDMAIRKLGFIKRCNFTSVGE